MSKDLQEITKDAMSLPPQERLALAGLLLEFDEHGDEAEARKEWEREILAHIRAVEDGSAVGVSYEEVMRSAQTRLP
jgi:predicted GTPase